MAEKKHTLYSPNGEKYETTSAVEATRLRNAYGYTTTAPKKASQSASGESKSSSK